ncbi:hypothetical protein [Pseudoxanthomonas koreensis]|uniref:hypothetical protein n=1 Tax=Pseudoxanthomonas koreensis TaxID=266061 RepID=UPI0035A603C9
MPSPPPPPVPQKLREMLEDYPEHIERLKEALDEYAKKIFHLMPFDGAIWAIEGRLETFYSEARAELQAAEASGDVTAIELAKAKKLLMGRARSKSTGGGMLDLDGLWNYFETNKYAFR